MMSTFPQKAGLAVILILAATLRITLASVNREANDEHWRVSAIIADQGRAPEQTECVECFQPKLYHGYVAQAWKFFGLQDQKARIICAQQINAIAGILTIVIIWLFLGLLSPGTGAKTLTFALVALNPRLIGINGQATNDTFVILFSTAAIYSLYCFLLSRKEHYFWGMTIFTIFAALSKGTGIVLFCSIALTLLIKLIASRTMSFKPSASLLPFLLTFVSLFLLTVPWLGGYFHKYQQYGSPFTVNRPVDPAPALFKETFVQRPGTTSVANAFFSFRLVDILKTPFITNGEKEYPRHRTSLWSQLYGRTHFIFFDQWPSSWQNTRPAVLQTGRIILVLALFPTLLLGFHFIRRTVQDIQALVKKDKAFFLEQNGWIFDLILWSYLAFIVSLNYLYRDFSWMKAIYLFPCLLPVTALLAQGIDRVLSSSQDTARKLFIFVTITLLSLYVLTIGILVHQLGGLS